MKKRLIIFNLINLFDVSCRKNLKVNNTIILNEKTGVLVFVFIFLLLSPKNLFTQSNCPENLERAERLFEQGIIEEIPGLLNGCIESGFNNEERMQAYKLLINKYIFDGQTELADQNMEEYLRRYPEYELSPTDPEEFSYLYDTYIKTPVLSVGLSGGVNSSFVNVIEPYAPYDLNNQNYDYSPSGIGFQLGLLVERYITEEINLNLEVHFTSNSINNTITINDLNETITNDQRINKISVPISGTYDFEYLGFNPFVRIGFSPSFNVNSTSTFTLAYTDNSHEDRAGADIDLTEQLSDYSFWAFFGGGVKYSIARGYIFFDTRLNIGLNNMIKPEKRFTIPEMNYYYHYESDDFSLFYPTFSLGWIFSFYNPRKKLN